MVPPALFRKASLWPNFFSILFPPSPRIVVSGVSKGSKHCRLKDTFMGAGKSQGLRLPGWDLWKMWWHFSENNDRETYAICCLAGSETVIWFITFIRNLWSCRWIFVQISALWRCISRCVRDWWALYIHTFFGISAHTSSNTIMFFWVSINPLVTGTMMASIFSNEKAVSPC